MLLEIAILLLLDEGAAVLTKIAEVQDVVEVVVNLLDARVKLLAGPL